MLNAKKTQKTSVIRKKKQKCADWTAVRAACTKKYRTILKTLEILRVKRQTCDNRQWKSIRYVKGRCLHFAGIGFFVAGIKNENRALHSSETLCFFVRVSSDLRAPELHAALLGNPDEIVPRQPEIIRTAGTSR